MVVHTEGPYTRFWRETNTFMAIELRELGLQLNTVYRANISVSTPSGQEFIIISFSKFKKTIVLITNILKLDTYLLSSTTGKYNLLLL